MRLPWRIVLSVAVLVLGGCTHLTRDTNQFYLAQSYLPLAKLPPPDNSAEPPSRCTPGPVIDVPRDAHDRATTKPLPGMMLYVIETSYSPTRDDAVPTLSEWRWTIPASQNARSCSFEGAAVPNWERDDLIKVRHLLSRAQHPQRSLSSNTQYFAEAIDAACAAGGTSPSCFELQFLDKFVNGLVINMRGQGDRPTVPGSPGSIVDGFDTAPPLQVLAGDGSSQTVGLTGLATWYRSLTRSRSADLFADANQAKECSRPFSDAKKPRTQDAEVCQFAQSSLEWRGEFPSQKLPGATLAPLSKLWLLRSGDPLLLMQPTTYPAPLDANSGRPCNNDPACPLAKRMAQGFVQFELLLPISIEGRGRDWVAVGTSIGDLERKLGLRVGAVRRSRDWLPSTIRLEENKSIEVSALSDGGRVALRFTDRPGSGRGVAIVSNERGVSTKDDVLFAPGDIVVLEASN